MSFLQETRSITWAQMRYRVPSMSLILLLLAGCLVAMQLAGAKPDKYQNIAATLSILLGGLAAVYSWGIDAAERRVRLLAMLPVSRLAIAVSRLAAVASLLFMVSFLTWVVSLPVTSAHGTTLRFAAVLGGASVWMVALLFSSYFFEEMNIALSHRRLLLWGSNILAAALFMYLLLVPLGDLFDVILEPETVAVGAFIGLVFGVGSAVLFHRRPTFNVGVSPWHGFPVDWSEEAD